MWYRHPSALKWCSSSEAECSEANLVRQTKRATYSDPSCAACQLRGRDLNPRPLGYEPNELPLLHPASFVLSTIRTRLQIVKFGDVYSFRSAVAGCRYRSDLSGRLECGILGRDNQNDFARSDQLQFFTGAPFYFAGFGAESANLIY